MAIMENSLASVPSDSKPNSSHALNNKWALVFEIGIVSPQIAPVKSEKAETRTAP
jgi:hypothetical protein